jgi:hypothetical protein
VYPQTQRSHTWGTHTHRHRRDVIASPSVTTQRDDDADDDDLVVVVKHGDERQRV